MKYLIPMLLMSFSVFAEPPSVMYTGSFSAETIYSAPRRIIYMQNISWQMTYTATAASGSCTMQVSNDNVNYIDEPTGTIDFTATGTTDFINRQNSGASWTRMACTSLDGNLINMQIISGGK